MLVVGIKPGHDGAIAVVEDRKVLLSLEGEKDSFARHAAVSPTTIFDVLEGLPEAPDVIARGGWWKDTDVGNHMIDAGYFGGAAANMREGAFCGQRAKVFSSSHVRSHIMMAAGMAPPDDAERRAVLVWEGAVGSFYILDDRWCVVRGIPVMQFPGGRYALPYTIADPSVPDWVLAPTGDESGKLMALAAYAGEGDAGADVTETVDRILAPDSYGHPKSEFRDSSLYNAGVEAEVTKRTAALLQRRMFEIFAEVAQARIPAGLPLYISGGCGLNCDWNTMWRELGHFASVFVPPCTNDSGSAVGTALDALHAVTGDPRVDWDVYCGLEFEWDRAPSEQGWRHRRMEPAALADALAEGRVVAWVQGRWEMGPRALGNRSLLAEPFRAGTRDRLNRIKQREGYRPIAPVCRIEDAGKVFDTDFPDPYMLYFRRVRTSELEAVTHVDGSARAQTVTIAGNRRLHELLSAFGERYGVGVLCNTSLNYKHMGFINRLSDLAHYCDARGVTDMVVGDTWFERNEIAAPLRGESALSLRSPATAL
jgi:hydroxymethyl cephem carbamoyltransferase